MDVLTDYYSEMRDGCRYGMLLREVHEVVAWVEDRQRRMDLLRSYHKAGWLTDVQWICAIEGILRARDDIISRLQQ